MKKILLLAIVALSLLLSSCRSSLTYRKNDGFGYKPTEKVNIQSSLQQFN